MATLLVCARLVNRRSVDDGSVVLGVYNNLWLVRYCLPAGASWAWSFEVGRRLLKCRFDQVHSWQLKQTSLVIYGVLHLIPASYHRRYTVKYRENVA